MNPCAGVKKANRFLPDLIRLFSDYSYVTTAYMTGKHGDGMEFTKAHASEADLIVSIGGDGTLNEVIDGLLKSGVNRDFSSPFFFFGKQRKKRNVPISHKGTSKNPGRFPKFSFLANYSKIIVNLTKM